MYGFSLKCNIAVEFDLMGRMYRGSGEAEEKEKEKMRGETYRVYVVDVFAEQPGDGNPAAVILINDDNVTTWPEEEWMNAVARTFRATTRDLVEKRIVASSDSVTMHLEYTKQREENDSHHADIVTRVVFLLPDRANERGGYPMYKIRWKTVRGDECPLCGHGSIAAASALLSELVQHVRELQLRTRDDVELSVRRRRVDDKDVLMLSMPRGSVKEAHSHESETDVARRWRRALFPDADDVSCVHLIEHIGMTLPLRDELFIVKDVETLRNMRPDIDALLLNRRRNENADDNQHLKLKRRGVIATTAEGCAHTHAFESRFWDADGNEDPVTGSIHATLGPFWASRRHELDTSHVFMAAFQTSPAMQRSGTVYVAMQPGREVVDVGGSALVVAHGHITCV